jgi:predicted type IV restriction endonuclease
LRIFQSLGWDTWDTATVWPEYQTGEGRADFALCHPASKPAILIEVKQPGKAEDAVRQALSYAFHVGVPFVVLSDGRTWSFYLPAEQGSYADALRNNMDAAEYKHVVLGLIFLKYISDAFEEARRARSRSGQGADPRTRTSTAPPASSGCRRRRAGRT